MKAPFDLLWPRPQTLELTGESLDLPLSPTFFTTAAPAAGHRLAEDLVALGFAPRQAQEAARATVHLHRDEELESELGAEGYRLTIGTAGVEITAAREAGLFYGAVTLAQWIALHRPAAGERPEVIRGAQIVDRPDFEARGVMLDISRDKVPRMDTLFDLVDLLAGLKYNQLQLYTEHTFAYRGHETVWRDASPMTGDEIRQLDAHCAERQIELVPNQQSFGHFHRWLVHPEYRGLAECPAGFAHPFSLDPEPFSLCPTDPRSLDLLADLYTQLLPNFTSRTLNVGLDETLDLGHGRSREACKGGGKERIYLDFLCGVRDLAAEHGRRIQFWGDIILQHPELLSELPDDAVALEWGYEADHPFAEDTRRFALAGREFHVCPGTSSWNSFAGRTRNALANLASAAVHGQANGASGYLVADWGDFGHLQPLVVSYPGMVAGAGFAWNAASAARPNEIPLQALVDHWVMDDPAAVTGDVLSALGDAGPPLLNGTAPFFMTVWAELERESERVGGVSAAQLERAAGKVDEALSRLSAARSRRFAIGLVEREIRWAGDLVRFGCRLGRERLVTGDPGPIAALGGPVRRELEKELRELMERHREIVLGRHRPGGIQASRAWLERVADRLASD